MIVVDSVGMTEGLTPDMGAGHVSVFSAMEFGCGLDWHAVRMPMSKSRISEIMVVRFNFFSRRVESKAHLPHFWGGAPDTREI